MELPGGVDSPLKRLSLGSPATAVNMRATGGGGAAATRSHLARTHLLGKREEEARLPGPQTRIADENYYESERGALFALAKHAFAQQCAGAGNHARSNRQTATGCNAAAALTDNTSTTSTMSGSDDTTSDEATHTSIRVRSDHARAEPDHVQTAAEAAPVTPSHSASSAITSTSAASAASAITTASAEFSSAAAGVVMQATAAAPSAEMVEACSPSSARRPLVSQATRTDAAADTEIHGAITGGEGGIGMPLCLRVSDGVDAGTDTGIGAGTPCSSSGAATPAPSRFTAASACPREASSERPSIVVVVGGGSCGPRSLGPCVSAGSGSSDRTTGRKRGITDSGEKRAGSCNVVHHVSDDDIAAEPAAPAWHTERDAHAAVAFAPSNAGARKSRQLHLAGALAVPAPRESRSEMTPLVRQPSGAFRVHFLPADEFHREQDASAPGPFLHARDAVVGGDRAVTKRARKGNQAEERDHDAPSASPPSSARVLGLTEGPSAECGSLPAASRASSLQLSLAALSAAGDDGPTGSQLCAQAAHVAPEHESCEGDHAAALSTLPIMNRCDTDHPDLHTISPDTVRRAKNGACNTQIRPENFSHSVLGYAR